MDFVPDFQDLIRFWFGQDLDVGRFVVLENESRNSENTKFSAGELVILANSREQRAVLDIPVVFRQIESRNFGQLAQIGSLAVDRELAMSGLEDQLVELLELLALILIPGRERRPEHAQTATLVIVVLFP